MSHYVSPFILKVCSLFHQYFQCFDLRCDRCRSTRFTQLTPFTGNNAICSTPNQTNKQTFYSTPNYLGKKAIRKRFSRL